MSRARSHEKLLMVGEVVEGLIDGSLVGSIDGKLLGMNDGVPLGFDVGSVVGAANSSFHKSDNRWKKKCKKNEFIGIVRYK